MCSQAALKDCQERCASEREAAAAAAAAATAARQRQGRNKGMTFDDYYSGDGRAGDAAPGLASPLRQGLPHGRDPGAGGGA